MIKESLKNIAKRIREGTSIATPLSNDELYGIAYFLERVADEIES